MHPRPAGVRVGGRRLLLLLREVEVQVAVHGQFVSNDLLDVAVEAAGDGLDVEVQVVQQCGVESTHQLTHHGGGRAGAGRLGVGRRDTLSNIMPIRVYRLSSSILLIFKHAIARFQTHDMVFLKPDLN